MYITREEQYEHTGVVIRKSATFTEKPREQLQVNSMYNKVKYHFRQYIAQQNTRYRIIIILLFCAEKVSHSVNTQQLKS